MKRSEFVSAGFLLTRRVPRDDHRSPDLLPATLLSASGCIGPFLPDTWAISWCTASRAERIPRARRFEIAEVALDEVIATVTDLVSDEARYGFPNVSFSIEAAATLARRALRDVSGLVLLEMGLHRDHVDVFCKEATPPASPPGFAPHGECGALAAIQRRRPLSSTGQLLGFEPIVFNASLSCSWLCNLLEREVRDVLGIRPNQHGFLPDLESARRAVAHISRLGGGAEPGLWLPWLLVEHSLEAA